MFNLFALVLGLRSDRLGVTKVFRSGITWKAVNDTIHRTHESWENICQVSK